MLSFKPTFSLSSFTFIKRLFSSSSLSALRVVLSAYLRLLIFLPAILILAHASSSPAFLMMYLGKFIPRYLILFVAVVNGIDFLISLSDFSLLVYRNPSDFCVLILYPATFLNSLISSNNFLILSLGFSMYSITSSANSESCTSLLSIWIHFIYFSFLIAIGKPSKIVLKNSTETGHPYLVPDLRGNAFRFSPLRIMFAVDLSYMLFTMLRKVPSVPIF